MIGNMIAYKQVCMSPFETGGNFKRVHRDATTLVMELHAEQEEIRSRRRVIQERLSMYNRQIAECSQERPGAGSKSVYAWLTGSAVSLIFGLLFSMSGISLCGSCGRMGLSTFLLLIGVILALRAWGEYAHESKDMKNHSARIEQYKKECDQLNEQLYRINLREAEIESSIESAKRFM